jgi:hypothetical protein
VAPHALQSSLSGPAVPDFLSDFLEQAAETLGEPLFGASNGPTGGPTPVTFLSDPDKLAALKAELEEKLLQIQEFEGRARQDSNLRPSDS